MSDNKINITSVRDLNAERLLAEAHAEVERLRAELDALWAKGPLLRLSRIDFRRMPVGGCEVMRVCYQADVLRRGKEPEEWFCNAEVVGEIRSDLSREANRMTMERAFHDLAQKLHDELLPLPDWFFKKTP